MSDTMGPRRVRRLRRLSTVKRWGVIPTVRTQTVAEHCYHMSWIALWLLEQSGQLCELSPPAEVWLHRVIMLHDESEAFTGDIPSPMKGHINLSRSLSRLESMHALGVSHFEDEFHSLAHDVYVLADILEALLFLHEENAMGNGSVLEVYEAVYTAAKEKADSLPRYSGGPQVVDRLLTECTPFKHCSMEDPS